VTFDQSLNTADRDSVLLSVAFLAAMTYRTSSTIFADESSTRVRVYQKVMFFRSSLSEAAAWARSRLCFGGFDLATLGPVRSRLTSG
jgi:hypothetical protein